MTLQEALDLTDEMKPNMMGRKIKVKYLQELEQLIYSEILIKHEHSEEYDAQPDYTEQTDPGQVLLAPDPYGMVYVYWLMSKIDMQNQEDARYNIDRALFENAYQTMADWWNRTYRPIPQAREIRI